MNTTTARPGLSWGGFSFAHVPMPSSSFPPLAWPPTVSRRHFCARVQRGRGEVKTQSLRKGHLQDRRAAFSVWKYPYTPATLNGLQRPTERPAGHKATPARSIRSKPGRYYLLHSYQTRNTNNIITHAIADKSIIAYITLIIYSGRWIAPRSVPPSDRTRHKHF